MNNLVRSIMVVTMVVLAFAGGVFVTLRAAEPTSEVPAAAQPAPPTAGDKSAPGTKPPSTKPPSTKPRARAPIVDEPTVAPDSQDSADNSVSFPADI
jgi:outer membrane biosynthesis protein TonB